jgi:PAS domain S-box-containing protein
MSTITALYVDDEPDLLEIARLFLEKDGEIRVDTCLSPLIARDNLRSKRYDIIISDYQMPEMDGIAFLKAVRSEFGPLPFILFTGRGREEVVIEAINNGADFYLQKGGDPQAQFAELAHKIRQAVSQKRAEASIHNHEQRESDIINFLPDATFAIDVSGMVIAWNRAMERMTGVSAPAIVGKGNYEYAIPFYHERRPILIDLVLKTDPATAARYPFIKREGKTLFSEITIPHFNDGRGAVLWFTASPLYDVSGTVVGAIESIRDITDRKRVEEALRENEMKFREMADMLPQIVYEADEKGILTYANALAFSAFGYTHEEFERGISILQTIVPEERDQAGRILKEFIAGSVPRSGTVEYHALRKDGSTFPVMIYNAPILRKGRVTGLRGIIVDISGQRQVEQQLKERERVLTTLISNLPGFVYRCRNDRDWTMTFISEGCREITGYDPEDFLENRGLAYNDIIHPDHRERLWEKWQGLLANRGVFEDEYPISTKSGETRWVWERGRGVFSEDNRLLFLEGFITDITERKRSAEELKKARDELELRVEERTRELFAANENLKSEIAERERLMGVLRRNEEQLKLKLDSVLSPDVDVGDQELANILDYQAVQSLMEEFSRLTGMSSAILDLKGNVIEATGWQDICTKFHRANEVTARFCTESDLYLAENMKPGEFVAYKCRNGLWDVVTPLYIGNNHVGNIYTGQFFYDDEIVDESVFVGQAEKYGFDREEYLAALRRVPRVSRENVRHLIDFLAKFTVLISRLSYSNLKLAHAISDHEQAEAAIRQSEAQYRTLFENSGSPLMIVDEDTTIIRVNREFEKVSGYSNNELAGTIKLATFMADGAERDKVLEYHRLRRASPDQVPPSYELQVTNRAGRILDMVISAAVIPDTKQSLIALTDITDQKRAEKELQALSRDLEQRVAERTRELSRAQEAYQRANEKLNLLSSITRHDISNQLMALKGFLEFSKKSLDDPARMSEFIAREEAITGIIEHQIAFTRSYQNMGVREPGWQDVEAAFRNAGASLPLGHVGLQSDCPGLLVYADPLFEKVFYNVIDNALRYGGEHLTSIRISSQETPDGLVLVCQDDGAGVSAADKQHLFERGFGKNTGLGLFLVREILGITGITIKETGEPGKGARFEMLVPVGMYRITPA